MVDATGSSLLPPLPPRRQNSAEDSIAQSANGTTVISLDSANSDMSIILARINYIVTEEKILCPDCGFISSRSADSADLAKKHLEFSKRCCSSAEFHVNYSARKNAIDVSETASYGAPALFDAKILAKAFNCGVQLKYNYHRFEMNREDSWKFQMDPNASLLARHGFYLESPGKVKCFACGSSALSTLECQDILGQHEPECPLQFGMAYNVPKFEPTASQYESFRTSGLCWREEKVDQYVHAGLSFYDNNSQIPVLQCTICKLMLIVRNIPSDADIMIEHAVHQPGCPFIVRYKGPYFASVHVAFRNLDLWKKGENFLHVHVPNMREALQAHPETRNLKHEELEILAWMKKDIGGTCQNEKRK